MSGSPARTVFITTRVGLISGTDPRSGGSPRANQCLLAATGGAGAPNAHSSVSDSEDAGRIRGSLGAYVEPGLLRVPMEVVLDGAFNLARGVRGGVEGGAAQQHGRSRDGTLSDQPGAHARQLAAGRGDRVCFLEGAANGARPTKVATDVSEGWIKSARARGICRAEVNDARSVNHCRNGVDT